MAEWLGSGSIAIPKLLLRHYKQLGLTEVEFMLLLHLHSFMEEGISFPTPAELSDNMTLTPAQCMETLRKLLQKGFVSIEEHVDQAILSEKYSLKPLWEKLVSHLASESAGGGRREEEQSVYTMFEQEFGRPLSPFECETLTMWMDQDGHDPAIIKAALREAVLSGKLNFRYIDRILFEWKKNGVRTIEQAKDYGKKFRKHQARNKLAPQAEPTQAVPFYNWLES